MVQSCCPGGGTRIWRLMARYFKWFVTMLLIPSIGPTKRLISRKKNFEFQNFSSPKWAKTWFLGTLTFGVQKACAPRFTTQIFCWGEPERPKDQHIQELEHLFSVSSNKFIFCIFLQIQDLGTGTYLYWCLHVSQKGVLIHLPDKNTQRAGSYPFCKFKTIWYSLQMHKLNRLKFHKYVFDIGFSIFKCFTQPALSRNLQVASFVYL